MRDLKFRMLTQSTDKILGYVDIYDLLRDGSDVLPDFEEAVLEGVEFEQYTGLKDKNGKEIYEGDIVEYIEGFYREENHDFEDIKTRGVVVWNDEYAGYMVRDFDGQYAQLCDLDEVIGNVHENPELLKGEE